MSMNTVFYNVKDEELAEIINDTQNFRNHLIEYNSFSLETLWEGVVFLIFKLDPYYCLEKGYLTPLGLNWQENAF